MNYGTLENELVTRLNDYFIDQAVDASFEALFIPEKQSEQSRPFDKSRVTVQYFNSTYQPAPGINEVSQLETITMRLYFETRDLRSDRGFYKLIELCKRSLLGYKPANCSKRMTIDKYDLVFYENNTFSPYIDFQTETVNVQAFDDTEGGPGFTNLTIQRQCP